MSQSTIMTIILMGTKMMSMGMSMMLMVTQVFNYVKSKGKETEANGYICYCAGL